MINFQLRAYIHALEHLDIAKTRARAVHENEALPENIKQLIVGHIGPIHEFVVRLGMTTALPRISRLMVALQTKHTTYGIILREIEELWNALDHDAYQQLFCHYPLNKVGVLLEFNKTWGQAIDAFPSAEKEIEEGVDCYALGHNAACVFHMARVGEIGLRTIARERGIKNVRKNVPVEWATWGVVLGAIEGHLKAIRNKPAGPKKDAALAFYDTILSDLRAIQSLYRDRTMHLRKDYNDGDAQDAMFRVRQLMITLSNKLGEHSIRAIPWSAWS